MKLSPPILRYAVVGVLAIVLAGCGGYYYDQPDGQTYYDQPVAAPVPPDYGPHYGVVQGIDYVPRGGGTSGAGAVVGAIAGGVIGHQFGSGSGNTAATIGGAIAGGLVGNEIERRARRPEEDYRVMVRMEDGSYRSMITSDDPNLRAGDPVVVDNGRIYRR